MPVQRWGRRPGQPRGCRRLSVAWVAAAVVILLAQPVGAREGAIEAIRNVSSRGPAVFGEVQRSRVNATDQAIAAGYILDFVVPWLVQGWLNDDQYLGTGGSSAHPVDSGDPLFFDPLIETPRLEELYFLQYPYAEQFGGYVYAGPWKSRQPLARGTVPPRLPTLLRKLVFQNRIDAGRDFDWRLTTLRANSRWEGFGRVSFDTSWAWLRETLGHGKIDQIGLFDANLLFNIVAHPRGRLRVGFGSNFSQDGKNSTRGFNLTATLDLFVIEPLVISAEWDAGTLGRAFLLHQRYAVGWMLDRFELALGYDQLRIDNVTIRSPQAALTVYF